MWWGCDRFIPLESTPNGWLYQFLHFAGSSIPLFGTFKGGRFGGTHQQIATLGGDF